MVISNNSKISFIVQTLAKLFDIESASDYDTEYFKKNNVSHAKLIAHKQKIVLGLIHNFELTVNQIGISIAFAGASRVVPF